MTKYDNLDPRRELEQIITEDLKRALEKRGFTVQHNGTRSQPAPAKKPDIVVYDHNTHINVEATKTTKSGADREFLSIKDHLQKSKRLNSTKKCFAIYVSPETHYRMMNACRDFSILNEDKEDLKLMPLCFENFELFIIKLIESHKQRYPKKEILSLFEEYRQFVDDERIFGILYSNLFSDDAVLKKELEAKEESKHQKTVEELIKNLLKLEDDLREHQGITHIDAIRTIIFLVFTKLYEEKREHEGKENRLKLDTFKKFQQFEDQEETKHAIQILFDRIKSDPELVNAKVFTETDFLDEKLDDDFVIDFFIEPFEKYHFFTTKVDGIGAAYEVLGMRTGKDVKAGQFFTPEHVVKFMVKLAELDQDDVILDPACGTARFLIYSMQEMEKNLKGRNKEQKLEEIKTKQLYGSDYDLNVAKLAKMNMYIHGDGKANIMDKDGLLLYEFDGKIDAILTNPPLGDQSYTRTSYDDTFRLERMGIIPKRNKTKEKLEEYKAKLEEREKLLETTRLQKPKDAKRHAAMIKKYNRKILELETKIRNGKAKLVVKGSRMKGGPLFVGASKHYLTSVRDSSAFIEWRGGKLLIIIDEGVLNTEAYSEIRDFIKKYFYIKAIISLSRDTFVPVSGTHTKTSILYAIKKEDPDAIQQEPIFFAHAEKVGIDTRKRICANHLFNDGEDVLSKYFDFKHKIIASYTGVMFNKQKFSEMGFEKGTIGENSHYHYKFPEEIKDRLDENYNNPLFDKIDELLQKTKFEVVEIGKKEYLPYITSGKTPSGIHYLDEGGIPFLGATQIIDECVLLENAPRIEERLHTSVLKGSQVKRDDVLVTIAGTYIGRCAVFKTDEECNCNQAIAILRLNKEKIIPEFLVKYLNSKIGQLFFGKLQHISNQSNINTTEITKIKVILPPKKAQEKMLKSISEKDSALASIENEIKKLKEQRDKVVLDFFGLSI